MLWAASAAASSDVSSIMTGDACATDKPACAADGPCNVAIAIVGDAARPLIAGLDRTADPDPSLLALGYAGLINSDGTLMCIADYPSGPICWLSLDTRTGRLDKVPVCE